MICGLCVFDVKSIRVNLIDSPSPRQEFTFIDRAGMKFVLTAYVEGPLSIEGAELIDLMTQPAPETVA